MLSDRDRAIQFLTDWDVQGYAPIYVDKLADLIAQGREAEREACAALVESWARPDDTSEAGDRIADAFNEDMPRGSITEACRRYKLAIAAELRRRT